MRRTRNIFFVGLFILLFAAAGSAFAHHFLSFDGAEFQGTVTQVSPAETTPVTSTPTVTIQFASGTTECGTMTVTPSGGTATTYNFSAILDGNLLRLVAVPQGGGTPSYLVNGTIVCAFGSWHQHGQKTASLLFQATSLSDGSLLEGTLTQQTTSS
jgi:hypothetical protein